MSGSRAQLLRYAATWVLVVSVTAGLSWGAISRAGEAATLLGAPVPLGSAAAPTTAGLDAQRDPVGPAPAAGDVGTDLQRAVVDLPELPKHPKPEPTESPRPVVRSVSTAAGQVWAYCVGDTAYRRSVVATDGWSFEFSREDNGRFEVKFQLAGAEEEEVEVKVRCEAGLPVFTTD
jgi:hypothetical protein